MSDFLFNQILNDVKSRPEYGEIGGDDQKYRELVDTVLEDWQDSGKIPDDYDIEGLRTKLKAEWRDIETGL